MKTDKESKIVDLEQLILDLEEIESQISSGNLKISEQIEYLEKAKSIVSDISTVLDEAKAKINQIEVDKE